SLLDASEVSAYINSDRLHVTKIPTLRDAEVALKRLSAVERGAKSRSARRWGWLAVEGRKKGLTTFQALIPKYYLSGNRSRKVPKEVDDFLVEYLLGPHAESPGLSRYRSYVKYRVLASELLPQYDPVSQRTFDK